MRKVPELRFAGFNGEWEEKIFGKVIERRSKSSENNSLPRVEYEDIIPEIGKLNKDIETKSSIKKGIYFESDDVLFGKLRPYLKNYLNPQFEGIAVGDFWILNNISGDNSFLFYYIQIAQFQYVANTSIGTKMPRSDWNLVSGSKFIHPSNNEQEKIGNLFKKLDYLIEIQEGKVAKLEDFKKSMLQKMFPKKDELVPEFRFDGFDGDLSSFRINELIEYSNGNTLEPLITENGDLEVLNLNSVSINGQLKGTSKYISSPYPTLEKNDIIMILSDIAHGNLIGKTAVIPESNKYVLNQRVAQLKPKNIDSYFLSYYINHNQKDLYALSAGTSQLNLSKTEILKYYVRIPSLEEQQKIGQFFKNLDTQIENEERLLESYKMMKKSLLQKMFV